MSLTDIALKNLKPSDKPFKKADGGGLYLLVKPKGAKLWRLDYRYLGARKTLAIGQYPTVSLVSARAAREAAKSLLAKDIDPGAHKKETRAEAAAAARNTFGVIADEYLEKMKADGRAESTIDKNTWMLKVLAKPLEDRPVANIKPRDVLELLRKIEQSGRNDSALTTRSAIGRVFRYAMNCDLVEGDPTASLHGALQRHVAVSHPAIVKESEIGALVRAVYGYTGWPSLVAAMKIQAMCFARPGETRRMEWTEIDLNTGTWSIPAEKTKLRRPLDVPLSRQAIEVIATMKPISGEERYVFKPMMHGKTVLSENSMNSALRRMGYTSEQHTAHGFRSTASTILNESKLFRERVIEFQLAHQDPNEVRRIYNRAEYWEERVEMMQWWADYLDKKASEKPAL